MATTASTGVFGGGGVEVKHRAYWWDVLVRLVRQKPLGLFGAIVVLVMIFAAIFAPVISPYDYKEIVGSERLKAPSAQYYMGTDNLGRDMFSRIVYGARISLRVGFSAVLISTIAATLIGVVSAYFGGW